MRHSTIADVAAKQWIEVAAGDVFRHVGMDLVADVVDGARHVEQVSIHPGYARQGLGRLLIGRTDDASRDEALNGLPLTTFRDVPWNAPCYSRLGSQVVPEDRLTPAGRALREAEDDGRGDGLVLGLWVVTTWGGVAPPWAVTSTTTCSGWTRTTCRA